MPRCYIGANRGGGNRFSKKPSFPGGFLFKWNKQQKNTVKTGENWMLGKLYPFSRVENLKIFFF